MELSYVFSLIRRWAWLLILGLVIGIGAGYLISQAITPVYEVSTKILVTRTSQDVNSEFGSLTDQELLQTFIELLKAKRVLEKASQQINFKIDPEKIKVEQILGSQVIQLTVEDTDPQRGITIANTILDVFTIEIDSILTSQYSTLEESLKLQIGQVEDKMSVLQDEIDNILNEDIGTQLENLELQITSLEEEILNLREEIDTLSTQPTTGVQQTEFQSTMANTRKQLSQLESTLRIYKNMDVILSSAGPSVTVSLEEMILSLEDRNSNLQYQLTQTLQSEITNLQNQIETLSFSAPAEVSARLESTQQQLDQLESILSSFQEIQVNLIVLGRPNQRNSTREDPRLQRLQSTIALYENEYLNLTENLSATQLSSSQTVPNITQIEPATIPEGPVRPQPLLYTFLSGIVGFMLSAMVIGLFESLDKSIKTPLDIMNIFGLSVLGNIGHMNKIEESDRWFHIKKQPYSPISEVFRVIQAKLIAARRETPTKTILISSIGPGVGKTTFSTNLASSFAKSNKNVVLIDANSRNPRIHEIYGIDNKQGFSDIIKNDGNIRVLPSSAGGMFVIPHGPGDVEGLIESDKVSRLINELETEYDTIIIDGPSMEIADAQILASEVDGVLLIVKPETSKIESAIFARDQIHEVEARLLGVVFNRFKADLRGLKFVRYQLAYIFRTITSSIGDFVSKKTSGTKSRLPVPEIPAKSKPPKETKNKYPDLLKAYEQNSESPIAVRYQAVRLLKLGSEVEEIEKITGCNRLDLMAWEANYDNFGIDALEDQNESKTRAMLSQVQKDEIKYRLREVTPKQVLGKDSETSNGNYWTIPDLVRAVKKWYGVEYQSRSSYYEILRYCDLVYNGKDMVYIPKESIPENGSTDIQ